MKEVSIAFLIMLIYSACNIQAEETQSEFKEEGIHFVSDTTALGKFIQVTANEPTNILLNTEEESISKVEIKPASLNMIYEVEGNRIKLIGVTPCKAAITINGDYSNPVYLFVNPKEPKEWSELPKNTIFFKSGIHDINEFKIPSDNTTIFLEEGAVLKGTIKGENVDNVKILGYGIIDGRAKKKAVQFIKSKNIKVHGPLIMSHDGWTNSFFECTNVNVKNIKVLSSGKYSDGIDLLATSHVTIDDIFIRNEDDCVAIKTKKYTYSGNVENIQVKNSTFWSGKKGNALEIGWELDAEFVRNIYFENIDIIRKETNPDYNFKRAALSIHHVGNAKISDIHYKDIRIESVFENLVWLELIPGNTWGSGGGSIENVSFDNIKYTRGIDVPVVINGGSSGLIKDVRFNSLKIKNRIIQSASDSVFQIDNAEVLVDTGNNEKSEATVL